MPGYGYRTVFKRFCENLLIDRQPNCWLWQGAIGSHGYGVLAQDHNHTLTAHRLAYEFFIAPIPKNKCVLHSCDVRVCCNPDHLWLGTRADNMRDMFAKGRRIGYVGSPGSKNPASKLTEVQVREIRQRLAAGESGYSLSKIFGINKKGIYQIRDSKIWKSA